MPYTLAKWALWLIAAAAIGLVLGWMLRGVRRASAVPLTEDQLAELDRLRARDDEMDRIVNEREGLRIQLDDCRASATLTPSVPGPAPADHSERERLAALVVEQAATVGDLRARIWNHEAKIGALQDVITSYNLSTAPRDPDLAHGAEVLGEKVRLNDLTVIEGIGPKIADLLQTTGGIKTWWQLHHADVATIRTLLGGAGPRFQIHDPSSWPQQAGMLARGEWEDFKDLVANLQGGRSDG